MNILTGKKLLTSITFIIIVVAFLTTIWPFVLENYDTGKTDQRSYLQLSLDIKDGVKLTDGNRHFLFPLMLSVFASREWKFFTTAKLVNTALGIVVLGLTFFLARKLFGVEVALLATTLTAFNHDVLQVFSKAIAEPLLIILFILVFYFWYLGAKEQKNLYFVLAGLFTGLAYLTKGTSDLLFICFIIWIVISSRWIKTPIKTFLSFVTVYFITIAPLLVYNLNTWGNPFFNYNSSFAMWCDQWDDVYLPVEQCSPTHFFATHSFGSIIARLTSGALLIIEKRLDILFPPVSLGLILLSILAISVVFIKRDKFFLSTLQIRDNVKSILIIPPLLLLMWFAFFSWYAPISSSNRHFLPILPMVNIVISFVFIKIISFKPVGSWTHLRGLLILFISVSIGTYSLWRIYDTISTQSDDAGLVWNIYHSDIKKNKELDELLQGLEAPNRTATVVNGPSQLIPGWRAEAYNVSFREIPKECKTAKDLLEFLTTTEADYLLVDPQTISHRVCLKNYFEIEKKDDKYSNFEIITPLPGLTLLADYRLDRTPIMIFIRRPVSSQ